jgi:hypothetical protein
MSPRSLAMQAVSTDNYIIFFSKTKKSSSVTMLHISLTGSLGANCRNLGITAFNSSSLSAPPPKSLSDSSTSSDAGKTNFNSNYCLSNLLSG